MHHRLVDARAAGRQCPGSGLAAGAVPLPPGRGDRSMQRRAGDRGAAGRRRNHAAPRRRRQAAEISRQREGFADGARPPAAPPRTQDAEADRNDATGAGRSGSRSRTGGGCGSAGDANGRSVRPRWTPRACTLAVDIARRLLDVCRRRDRPALARLARRGHRCLAAGRAQPLLATAADAARGGHRRAARRPSRRQIAARDLTQALGVPAGTDLPRRSRAARRHRAARPAHPVINNSWRADLDRIAGELARG